MKIFNGFRKQYKLHPIIITIFILAFFISSIIISVTVSTIVSYIQINKDAVKGFDNNTIEIKLNYANNYNHKNMLSVIEKINEDTKVRLDIDITQINENNERKVVIGEYFKKAIKHNYPLIDGRFYNESDVESGRKVLLLGKELEKYIIKKENKDLVYIDKEEYEVIGVVGYENKESAWDTKIFMPITSFTQISLESFQNIFFSKIYVSSTIDSEMASKTIIRDLKNIDNVGTFENKVEFDGKSVFKESILGNLEYIFMGILIVIFAIVNLGIISYFWISDRVFEIGVRKAFGISNKQISILLFMDIFCIILIASVLAIIIQLILSFVIDNILGYSINLSIYNILFIIIINIIITGIVSTGPIVKAIKIEAIEILKR